MPKPILTIAGTLLLLILIVWGVESAADYCIWHFFHRHLSFLVNTVIGLVLSEILVPALLITWILVSIGIIQ